MKTVYLVDGYRFPVYVCKDKKTARKVFRMVLKKWTNITGEEMEKAVENGYTDSVDLSYYPMEVIGSNEGSKVKRVYIIDSCGRFPMIVCIGKEAVQKRFRAILKEWTHDTDKEIEQGVKDGEFINEVGDEFYYYHVKVI